MMKAVRIVCTALALVGVLALSPAARAEFVSYVTVGTFTGGTTPNTSTFTGPGVTILFTGATNSSVSVPPASQVSLGTFNTTGTTATTATPVSSGFRLDVFQTTPTGGTTSFLGTLSGTLTLNNSQAFIQFATPLTSSIGTVLYSIASADNNTPGRVNIAPPSTNNGMTTIVGLVNVVPEPSSLVLAGLMGPGLLVGLVCRGRLQARRAAA